MFSLPLRSWLVINLFYSILYDSNANLKTETLLKKPRSKLKETCRLVFGSGFELQSPAREMIQLAAC